MYSRPSASQIRAPQARVTTRSVVATPRGTYRSRSRRTWSTDARSSTRIDPEYRTIGMRGKPVLSPMQCAAPIWSLDAAAVAPVHAVRLGALHPRDRPARGDLAGARAPLRRQHAAGPAAVGDARDGRRLPRADPVLPARG